MKLKDKILKSIKSGSLTFKNAKAMCDGLGVKYSERKTVTKLLGELEDEGEIIKDGQGGYATPEQLGAFIGVVQGNERGFAFIIPEDREAHDGDYFVPRRSLGGAMNKDVVLAVHKRGTEDEAFVVKIIERGMKRVVGTFERDKRAGYVIPDDRRFDSDVYVPLSLCMDARPGDKVVAEITSYPKNAMVGGKIVEILGESGDFYTEELSIIRSYGLIEQFPDEVERQAEEVAAQKISPRGRRDLRGLLTVTIDGEDTRDIDDAVSLERDGENYVLGVHIADVSHYVKLNGKLDREAYARGTSVYFPDRVLPMLPKALSNGACSLNEGEDRYTLSCVMEVNGKGDVVDGKLAEGVIRSAHRMTYTKVAKMLEGDAALCAEYADILPMCEQMRELAEILIRKRDRRGSVDLDVREADIRYSDGRIEVRAAERDIAHRIIEEFMILANETVASFAAGWEAPFVYRVHDKPSEEKAEGFSAYLRELGLSVKFRPENVRPGEYGKILKRLGDGELARVVNRVMLRSMSKARYSEENAGHFGLASECYCHFTSPIRRYPDLLVHRIVKSILEGEGDRLEKKYGGFVANAAQRCSATERRAEEAERAVDELYKVWYMRAHLGESFEGVVSGVTAFGIFVELENTIEGRIRIEDLPEDDYTFVEERYLLRGKVHSYKIGDAMRVTVAACDIGTRRVDFVPAQGKRNEK